MKIDDVYLVIISLLLVFSVLIGISLFISFVSVLLRKSSSKKDEEAKVVQPIKAADVPKVTVADEQSDDQVIVAAIIAAITAHRAKKNGIERASRFRVVSFRRTGGR